MVRRQTLRAVVAVGAGLLALLPAGCQPQPLRLKVPISNWPGYEYPYLASKLGLDRPEGLVIEPAQFPDPQSIVHAYLRGELPLAQLTTVEAVDLCARIPKRCPVVVLVLDESLGGDQLVVRNDVPSIKALRGKTVAVTFSTLGPYVLHRALQRNGLGFNDVTVRNIPLAQMPKALANGDVHAAAIFPPFSEYAQRHGQSRVLFDSREIPGEIFDVLVVDPTYLRDHGRQVALLIRVWQQAHGAARKHPEQAAAIMAARERLSPAEFREAERGLRYFPLQQQQAMLSPGGAIATNLRQVQQVQRELGLSAPDAPIPPTAAAYVTEALQSR
jgi:NitT/TauT family transport system substrate-binding protein